MAGFGSPSFGDSTDEQNRDGGPCPWPIQTLGSLGVQQTEKEIYTKIYHLIYIYICMLDWWLLIIIVVYDHCILSLYIIIYHHCILLSFSVKFREYRLRRPSSLGSAQLLAPLLPLKNSWRMVDRLRLRQHSRPQRHRCHARRPPGLQQTSWASWGYGHGPNCWDVHYPFFGCGLTQRKPYLTYLKHIAWSLINYSVNVWWIEHLHA